jgi:hypothetical protein
VWQTGDSSTVNKFALSRLLRLSLSLSAPSLAALWSMTPNAAQAAASGRIQGVVKDKDGKPIAEAQVMIQCNCFEGERTVETNARGIFVFRNLPAGEYTVQAFGGNQTGSSQFSLTPSATRQVDFELDDSGIVRVIPVEKIMARPGQSDSENEFETEDVRGIQAGDEIENDGWQTAKMDSGVTEGSGGGIRIGASTVAEQNYELDDSSAKDPVTGAVAISVITPFLESISVRSGGYDAEFGGASGGQIAARRVTGNDEVRGSAGIRFTPTLAQPRFITGTDEALRVTQVQDFGASAWAVVSGPIVKEKLHYTVGLSPTGARNSLYQEFRARVDKDGSQGQRLCAGGELHPDPALRPSAFQHRWGQRHLRGRTGLDHQPQAQAELFTQRDAGPRTHDLSPTVRQRPNRLRYQPCIGSLGGDLEGRVGRGRRALWLGLPKRYLGLSQLRGTRRQGQDGDRRRRQLLPLAIQQRMATRQSRAQKDPRDPVPGFAGSEPLLPFGS